MDVYIYIYIYVLHPLNCTSARDQNHQHWAAWCLLDVYILSQNLRKNAFLQSPQQFSVCHVFRPCARGGVFALLWRWLCFRLKHVAHLPLLWRVSASQSHPWEIWKLSPPSQQSAITHQASWTKSFLLLLSFVKIFANPVDGKNRRALRVTCRFSGSVLRYVVTAAPLPWTAVAVAVFRHLMSSHFCQRKAGERKVTQVMDALEEAISEQIGFPRPSSFPV